MKNKAALIITLVILSSLIPLPTTRAGEITGQIEPPADLGVISVASNAALNFGANFSYATQSLAIIIVNFSEVGFTLRGFTVEMDGVDVSYQSDLKSGAGTLTLNCSSIQPANGLLNIELIFQTGHVAGKYTFEWRYIYVAFQEPPNPPTTIDVSGESQVEVIFNFEIPLYTGWNLIGIPMNPRDPSLEGVFAGNLSKVEYVYGFDNELKEYYYWISGLPPEYQTLKDMEPGKGYWVHALEDFNQTIPLKGEQMMTLKKVGLILATGGLGDKSFNDISFAGVRRANEELGIEFDYVEPATISDYEGFLRSFAETGEYAIIISVGFDQADALSIIADEYPDQDFAIVDMVVDKPNVASLLFRANEGSFLVGVVAGMMTTTEIVGFVGGVDMPLIWDFFIGYEAGVNWANPSVTVLDPVFVGSFANTTRGKELANGLADLGADAIYPAAGKSGLGSLEAVHERGLIGFGVDMCQCYLYPEVVASMTKRVDYAVYKIILSALLCRFQGGVYTGGVIEKWTGLCRLPDEEWFWEESFSFEHDPLPMGVLDKVIEARKNIILEEIIVPSAFQ